MIERPSRLALWLVFVAIVAAALHGIDRPLANPDEGRYSEIAREMAASGDWVTPRLNGIKYFEKPPLQYWVTAAVFRLLGESELSARLYGLLCTAATLLVVAYAGRRISPRDGGAAALLALASSPYFLAMGGVVTLDMGLALWTTVALCAFLVAECAEDHDRRRWILAAWAASALAVLSKGLVGLVFPAAGLFLYALLRRDWGRVLRMEWAPGILVFLAIAAPWFVAVSFANPEFPEFFFIHEHFRRFLTTEHRRVEPWWYFLPIVFVGFLPWLFALPAAVARAADRSILARGFQAPLFALVFGAFIVAFFSASGSKLPGYVVPAVPALALMLSRYLAEAPTRRLALWTLLVAPAAVGLGAAAWVAPERARDPWMQVMLGEARPAMLAAAAALLASTLVAARLFSKERRWPALACVALGSVAFTAALMQAYGHLSPRVSSRDAAAVMKPLLKPSTRLYAVRQYEQSLPFYLGRTMTLVELADEFSLGLATEPQLAIADLESFRRDWLRPGEAMAIMQPDLAERLLADGFPMLVLHKDPRRVLVRKP